MLADPEILNLKYISTIEEFASVSGLSLQEAFDFFYTSRTYEFMSEGVSDFHCLSEGYLAENLMKELKAQE